MHYKLSRRSVYVASSSFAITLALYYNYTLSSRSRLQRKGKEMGPTYEATFSVPITCKSCTEDISRVLSRLPGIQETSYSISSKLVRTKGNEPPSNIVAAIESTGRAAILRGSGNPNSAAVCILETPPSAVPSPTPEISPVRGLLRLIELGDKITMLDLTLTSMDEGRYRATVRSNGDISNGRSKMGDVFTGLEGNKQGELGELMVDAHGRGTLLGETDWRVWELVGRGVLVERKEDAQGQNGPSSTPNEIVVGVVARSAGTWENEKTVCSCTGKTVWDEREQMVGRGML